MAATGSIGPMSPERRERMEANARAYMSAGFPAEQSEETLGHAVRQRSRWQITHRKVLSRFHSFDQLAASASSLRRRRTRVIRAEDSGEAEESVTRVAEPAATESAVRKSTAAASEETLVRRGYGNFKPACPEAGCISFAG